MPFCIFTTKLIKTVKLFLNRGTEQREPRDSRCLSFDGALRFFFKSTHYVYKAA